MHLAGGGALTSFSERMGYGSPRSEIQKTFVDEELRLDLWNAFYFVYLQPLESQMILPFMTLPGWLAAIWTEVMRRPAHEMPSSLNATANEVNNWLMSAQWYRVYDFVEYVAKTTSQEDPEQTERFMMMSNNKLEKNISAYRFVNGEIAPVIDEVEIQAVEAAVSHQGSLAPVGIHLQRALELLADKETPDYRNSIKESISSVETLSRVITDDSKATLGKALKKLDAQKDVQLHPALRDAFSKLYGYTSDESGIRHALTEESDLDVEDATFMLVACSAFVNYLIQKATKAEMDLS